VLNSAKVACRANSWVIASLSPGGFATLRCLTKEKHQKSATGAQSKNQRQFKPELHQIEVSCTKLRQIAVVNFLFLEDIFAMQVSYGRCRRHSKPGQLIVLSFFCGGWISAMTPGHPHLVVSASVAKRFVHLLCQFPRPS